MIISSFKKQITKHFLLLGLTDYKRCQTPSNSLNAEYTSSSKKNKIETLQILTVSSMRIKYHSNFKKQNFKVKFFFFTLLLTGAVRWLVTGWNSLQEKGLSWSSPLVVGSWYLYAISALWTHHHQGPIGYWSLASLHSPTHF